MLQRRDRLGPDYFTDGECCKGTSGWTLCQPEPQRRQRRSIRPGPASRHQHSTRYARGRRRLRPDLHGRVEPHAPADEPGGTGRVGTASGSRSLAAPTGRAPAPSVDAHRPRGLARPPPAVCCRAAGSQAAGKLPVATTLLLRSLRGARHRARLYTSDSLCDDGGRATSAGNAPTSPMSLVPAVRTVVSQARGRGAPGARSQQPIYLPLGVSESRIVQPTRPTVSLPWCFPESGGPRGFCGFQGAARQQGSCDLCAWVVGGLVPMHLPASLLVSH